MSLAKKMRISNETNFKKISKDDICFEYGKLFLDSEGWALFRRLEKEIVYLPKEETTVEVYGRRFPVPRQVVAYGDEGIKYSFSGSHIETKPWTPLILEIKQKVQKIAQEEYNYVLVNRYNSGKDYIGSHKDNEKDLDPYASIASVSFGQKRDFIFSRKNYKSYNICLENGSLLLMKYPTNVFWYHSLPRANISCARINMTFRKMIT